MGVENVWPAQHDWLRRYFVFERATYALEAFVAVQKLCISRGYSVKMALRNMLCNEKVPLERQLLIALSTRNTHYLTKIMLSCQDAA